MNISNNILKHHLKNVYFLSGTACGGKTTMSKIIADKHGFLLYEDNIYYGEHKEIATPEEQPNLTRKFPSWEYYFNRPVPEYSKWLSDSSSEELEMILVDLLRLPSDKKIIVDLDMTPEVAKQITDYNRVAFLVTEPEFVIKDYYDREHHREILECIMSLPDPDKALKNSNDLMIYGTEKTLNNVYESGLFYIKRDENSTIEKTLSLLEKHFEL
jgi:hypothetical protein